jgi:hypothetical protein
MGLRGEARANCCMRAESDFSAKLELILENRKLDDKAAHGRSGNGKGCKRNPVCNVRERVFGGILKLKI